MNFFSSLPQYGVYVLGLNLLLCGLSEGFIGLEGMEEMFPLLMLGGMGGGQSNYVPQRPVMPPLLRPTLPPTPSPPVYKPPQTITWRWVPNMRYTWPLGNNMQWPQYNPYMMPLANNAMGKAGAAFNTNTISGVKSSAGSNMPVPAVPNVPMMGNPGAMMGNPGAMMGNPGAMMGNPGAMMGNAGTMMNGGGPVPPAGGMMNGMGLAGSNMAATKQMTWNTQSQTTSKGPTAM